MRKAKNYFLIWLIVMFLITFTSLLVYSAAQQTLRQGANENPAILATETKLKLERGISPKDAVPAEKFDISKSLNTFVMVYDSNNNLVSSSAIIENKEPSYPKGVLNYVSNKGEDRVTWQPKEGLRFATIAIKYNNGYIVAGQSLFETERTAANIGLLILMAWACGAVFSTVLLFAVYLFQKRN